MKKKNTLNKVENMPVDLTTGHLHVEGGGVKGTSTEALINTDTSAAARREKSMEIVTKFVKTITTGGGDVTPFVIGVKDGVPIIEECIINSDGSIELPSLKMNTQEDIKTKSGFVRRILEKIKPVLHSDIEKVTYVALMRKDAEKLQKMMMALKDKKTKPRLENRVGCIYLIIDEYEVVI